MCSGSRPLGRRVGAERRRHIMVLLRSRVGVVVHASRPVHVCRSFSTVASHCGETACDPCWASRRRVTLDVPFHAR